MNLRNFSPSLVLAFVFIAGSALAAAPKQINATQDVDSLGGNEALIKMASSLDPQNKSRIVQNRLVDRHNRLELGLNYGGVAGGNPYLKTQNFGAAADFHFSPRFSLGVRYYDYGNDLTPEGRRVFNDARSAYATGNQSYQLPDIDTPLHSVMAVADWYPIYGKINLLDWGIAQFDMYLLGGGGQIQLSSGSTSILTAGGGFGFWLNKHFAVRGEARYETYKAQVITGTSTLGGVVGTVGIGYLL